MSERQSLTDERLDALLHTASAYDLETTAPIGLAARALAARGPRHPARTRLAWGGAAAAVIAVALVAASIRAHRVTPVKRDEVANVPPTAAGSPPQRTSRMKTDAASGQGASEVARVSTNERTTERHLAVPHLRASHTRTQHPPRVRLREHVIRRYASGVISPVWVELEDGTVVPGVMSVPDQEDAVRSPELADAPDRVMFTTAEGSK